MAVFRKFSAGIVEVAKAVRKNALDWAAKAIFAALLGGAVFLWRPIRDDVVDPVVERVTRVPDISREAAIEEARRYVGSGAIVAIPFHNVGDSRQHIAVWAEYRHSASEPPEVVSRSWWRFEGGVTSG